MPEGWEVIICPICCKEIHRQFSAPIYSRGRVSSRDYQAGSDMLTAMVLAANEEHERMVMAAKEACATHFREQHTIRFRLWKRLKWAWLLQRRWPWRKVKGEVFDFSSAANT